MSDDPGKRSPQDSARVNVHEEHEVRYWTGKWDVTREELTAAVGRAGVMVTDVARELGKA